MLNLGTKNEEGFGGFVSIMLGEDADRLVNTSYGEGAGDKVGIPEAYISYASGAWSLKAGRYGTLAGYEVVSDAANPLLSRSCSSRPRSRTTTSGIRTAFSATDSTTLYLGLANSAFGGFADDTNEQKTVEAGIAIALSDSFSVGLYDYYGVENDIGDVNYLDFVATFTATEKLTPALNFDQYSDDFGDITGIAGYGTYKLNDRWTTTIRVESLKRDFDDGPNYTVNAATLALGFHAGAGIPPADGSPHRRRGRRHLSEEDVDG